MVKDEMKLEVLVNGKLVDKAITVQRLMQVIDTEGRLIDLQVVEAFDEESCILHSAKIVQTRLRTIKCDLEGCSHDITFDPALAPQVIADNPWMSNVKIVTTGDGRNLCYCSDECLVKATSTGILNMPTKKVIDIATGANAMKQAAAQAEQQKAAETAIRTGGR